jgi:uncharacterized protein involved in exopolysaccharide biosynthesis
MLTQQLEQVKMSEGNDRQVQQLDVAVPPDRHARPQIILDLALAAATALFFGTVLAFTLHYLASLRPEPAVDASGRAR